METDHQRHGGLTLRSSLAIARRRIWVLIAIFVLTVGATAVFSALQEKEYTGEATLFFRDAGLDQRLFGSTFLAGSNDPAREAATNVELVSLERVAERAGRQLGMTGDDVEAAVDVSEEGQADLVTIAARDPDPEQAAAIANAVARQYVAFRRSADQRTIDNARQLVKQQLENADPEEAQAEELQKRLDELTVFGALQTGNAELVQPAVAPTSPSSPKVARNLALGIVLGPSLRVRGRGAARPSGPAGARAARSRRPVRATRARTAAREPAADPKRRDGLRRPPAGDDRRLPLDSRQPQVLQRRSGRCEPCSSPRRCPGMASRRSRGTSPPPQASVGERALLIEADLRRPSLARQIIEPVRAGLSEVLSGQIGFREAVVAVPIATSSNGSSPPTVDVLFAGSLPPNPSDLIESERMGTLIKEAERDYDLVVVDTPPTSLVADAVPLVRQVDGVIVVMRLAATTEHAAERLKEQLDHLGATTLGVVVNAVSTRNIGYGAGYYGAAGAYPDEGSRLGGLIRRRGATRA